MVRKIKLPIHTTLEEGTKKIVDVLAEKHYDGKINGALEDMVKLIVFLTKQTGKDLPEIIKTITKKRSIISGGKLAFGTMSIYPVTAEYKIVGNNQVGTIFVKFSEKDGDVSVLGINVENSNKDVRIKWEEINKEIMNIIQGSLI